jgi:hypothetical protein
VSGDLGGGIGEGGGLRGHGEKGKKRGEEEGEKRRVSGRKKGGVGCDWD